MSDKKPKKKDPKVWPHQMDFTDLTEMMQEVRIHASMHRQVAIIRNETSESWSVTVMGAPL